MMYRAGFREAVGARVHYHSSDQGLCLSAFLVVRRANAVLLGRPRGTDAWPEKAGYWKRGAIELEKQNAWLLSATHLLMEESPDHAARRICREWAGIKRTPRFVMVQSHLRPYPPARPKGNHWDICFVYELRTRRLPTLKPWWAEMKFVPFSKVRSIKVGRGHLDVLEGPGYIPPAKSDHYRGRNVIKIIDDGPLALWIPSNPMNQAKL